MIRLDGKVRINRVEEKNAIIQTHRENGGGDIPVRKRGSIFWRGLLPQDRRRSVWQCRADLPGWFHNVAHWIAGRELSQSMGEKLDCLDHTSRLARPADRHSLNLVSAICSQFVRTNVYRFRVEDLPIRRSLPRIVVRLLRVCVGCTSRQIIPATHWPLTPAMAES